MVEFNTIFSGANEVLIDSVALSALAQQGGLWSSRADFEAQLQAVLGRFSEDKSVFSTHSQFVFEQSDVAAATHENASLLDQWFCTPESAPSLSAMCSVAVEQLGIEDEIYQKAIVNAGFLADIRNNHEYHNNFHFRKVLVQVMRLIAAHNRLHDGDGQELNEREQALLLIAAAIHDLGHDGKSNMAQGVPYPGRLEQRSVDLACRAFEAIGFDDREDLQALNIMVLTTDVSSSSQCMSYCDQMKAAYRYHFEDGNSDFILNDEIKILRNNSRLALLSCLLHEADIGTSAGLSYGISQIESRLLAEETGVDEIATPRGLLNFFKLICGGQMQSDAALHLYQENMDENRRWAEEGLASGNMPFALLPRASEVTSSVLENN